MYLSSCSCHEEEEKFVESVMRETELCKGGGKENPTQNPGGGFAGFGEASQNASRRGGEITRSKRFSHGGARVVGDSSGSDAITKR